MVPGAIVRAAPAYGAVGSLMALLLWIYYSAQIFFFGAVVTRQRALRARRVEGEAAAAASA
ncbi:virulence factor BrkB family protein [Bordetella holmesii ATCC 51541]|nr:virulence factor BrkB family protein [Bordetella holmesii ATCC 51541]